MKTFEYAAPKSTDEAVALLSDKWGDVEVLAGGTDLITSLKQEIISPKRVVSLKNIAALRGIELQKNGSVLRLGAMTRMEDLLTNADVRKNFPALATAAKNLASPQMLAMGTVGGDLCQRPRCWYFRNGILDQQNSAAQIREGQNRYHAIFATDGPALFVSASSLGPALVALDATMTAEGPRGKTRTIPAAEFFRAPRSGSERETALNSNEVLTDILIPVKGLKNAVYEVRHRYGLDWPYVTATVAFSERNGTVADARVVLGQVAPMPWPAGAAAKALNGSAINEASAATCGEAAVEGAKPLDQNAYKIQLVKTAVKRAVLAAHAA